MVNIRFVSGDITAEDNGLIIHGVNCRGVMGSGVALAIKNKWPIAYDTYLTKNQTPERLGEIQIVKIDNGLYVGNCFTQATFGPSGKRYADPIAVKSCIIAAAGYASTQSLILKSPKIASDRGGLDWDKDVYPSFVIASLIFPNITIEIFEYIG